MNEQQWHDLNQECLAGVERLTEQGHYLAGFYLLEARDLSEAVQLASRIPPARFGTIEVRPVRELPPLLFS